MPLPLFKKSSATIKHIIAIAAGKGGVGKSFVTATLARYLKRNGIKVGLLDADLYGPSLEKMIPQEKDPSRFEEKLYPALAEGMPLISMAHFRKEAEGIIIRAPIAAKLIQQFINDTEWGDLDYLLIDFPPGTGDIAIELAQKAKIEGVILVTTPQEISLLDVRRAAKMFQDTGTAIVGVVENMSYFLDPITAYKHELFGSGGGALLANELGAVFITQIPLVPEAGKLSDLGLSIFLGKDKVLNDVKDSFQKIAETLFQHKNIKKIRRMEPSSPHAFLIEWADGTVQNFELKKLLAKCPCAACQGNIEIDFPVTAKGIFEVGKYAIKIDFERGCKNGIFPYDYLRTLGSSPI